MCKAKTFCRMSRANEKTYKVVTIQPLKGKFTVLQGFDSAESTRLSVKYLCPIHMAE